MGKVKAGKYESLPYNAEIHPKQIIEILSDGDSVAGFCAPNNICRKTFYNWLDEYPEFKKAYNIGVEYAERWLTNLGKQGMKGEIPGFNATVWSMFMRNRCRMAEHRTVPIDFASCKTSMEKVNLLDREIAAGKLTTSEAKHLAEYIKACAEVNEKTEVAKQVDELMKLAGKA